MVVIEYRRLRGSLDHQRFFGLRSYEKKRPASYLYFGIAVLLLFLLFPQQIAIPCILCASFTDPIIGETRYHLGKKKAYAIGFIISLVFPDNMVSSRRRRTPYNLSVAENIFAGPLSARGAAGLWRIDWPRMNADARALLARLHLDIDVTRLLVELLGGRAADGGDRARAQRLGARADPRRADLEPRRARGRAAVRRHAAPARRGHGDPVRHPLPRPDVRDVRPHHRAAQRRARRRVPEGRAAAAGADPRDGRARAGARPPGARTSRPRRRPARRLLLQAQGLGRRGQLQPVDLSLRARRGASASAACSARAAPSWRGCCSGSTAATAASCASTAQPVRLATARCRRSAIGMAMCPEDRKVEGIVGELSVRENIVLALQARLGLRRFLSARASRPRSPQRFVAGCWASRRPTSTRRSRSCRAATSRRRCSARWLATEPRLLILDEPTRGIDVAAKQEIMDEILELARQRLAVLFISSEMDEVVRVSDRIVVLRDRAQGRRAAGRQLRAGGVPPDRGGRLMPSALRTLAQHRLFWPAATLVLLLAVNAIVQPRLLAAAVARRPPLRQPDRHPQPRRAAGRWWRWA